MSWFGRTMGCKEKTLQAWLDGDGDSRSSGGYKSVNHDRDSSRRRAQSQASQPGNLQASYFRENIDRIAEVGFIESQRAIV